LPSENIGDISIATSGKSLKIMIYPNVAIESPEELYIDLKKMNRVPAHEWVKTPVARRV
jgi:hypothetical protein